MRRIKKSIRGGGKLRAEKATKCKWNTNIDNRHGKQLIYLRDTVTESTSDIGVADNSFSESKFEPASR